MITVLKHPPCLLLIILQNNVDQLIKRTNILDGPFVEARLSTQGRFRSSPDVQPEFRPNLQFRQGLIKEKLNPPEQNYFPWPTFFPNRIKAFAEFR